MNCRLKANLTPVYPTTQGLSQPLLRQLTDQALQKLTETVRPLELLPEILLSNSIC